MKIYIAEDFGSDVCGYRAGLKGDLYFFSTAEDLLYKCQTEVPEGCIIDIILAGDISGLEAVRILRENYKGLKIAAVTSLQSESLIRELTKLKCLVLLKKYEEELYETLNFFFSSGKLFIPEYINKTDDLRITERQAQIIPLVERGLSIQEIADKICLSEASVKYHIGKLLKIFNCKNRIQLRNRYEKDLCFNGRQEGSKEVNKKE